MKMSMKPRFPVTPPGVVWRISESTPMGEWVDSGSPSATRPSRKDLPEVSYGSWVTSSFDLLHGTEVIEDDSTVPGELLDALFRR
jgi:hypothetical protein